MTLLKSFDLVYEDLPLAFFNEVESVLFLCDTCGWWFEVGEESDNEEELTCISCEE